MILAVSSIGRASSSGTTSPLPISQVSSVKVVVELEGSRFESWTALAPTNRAGKISGLFSIVSVKRVDRFRVDSLTGVTTYPPYH